MRYSNGMHSDLVRLIELRKISPELANKLDKISPGHYCHHKTWGTGKILKWSLTAKSLLIDFQNKPEHQIAMDLAMKTLTLLEEDHFLVDRHENADSLQKLAQASPIEFMRTLLKSHDNAMRPEEIELTVKGTIIAEEAWKSWWDKTRAEMRHIVDFILPTKKGEPIILRTETFSYTAAVLADLQAHKNLSKRIRIVDAIQSTKIQDDTSPEAKTQLAGILDLLDEDVRNNFNYTPVLAQILDIATLRDTLAEQFPSPSYNFWSIGEIIKEHAAILNTAVPHLTSTKQQIVYAVMPEALGEAWVKCALRLFNTTSARAIAEIAKFIIEQGKGAELTQFIKDGILRHSLSPDALIWTCRNRTAAARGAWSLAIGSALLAPIEKDHTDGGPSKVLRLKNLITEDKQLLQDIVEGQALGDIMPFAKNLYNCSAFPDLERKSLIARLIKVQPDLHKIVLMGTTDAAEKEPTIMLVSWDSLATRKAEYEELVNVKIPQNTKNLAFSRAEGDLRENGGYQDAKEAKRVLNRRRAELERDLAMARGTDFAKADTSAVSMGTVVTLQDDAGLEIDYTILGAWDTDIQKHIISYLSDVAQILIGKKIGDSVSFVPIHADDRKHTFVIKKVSASNP